VIHRPDSRAFLKDPHWNRDDIYASMRNFRENSPDQDTKLALMQRQAMNAHMKAYETTKKLELV